MIQGVDDDGTSLDEYSIVDLGPGQTPPFEISDLVTRALSTGDYPVPNDVEVNERRTNWGASGAGYQLLVSIPVDIIRDLTVLSLLSKIHKKKEEPIALDKDEADRTARYWIAMKFAEVDAGDLDQISVEQTGPTWRLDYRTNTETHYWAEVTKTASGLHVGKLGRRSGNSR